MKTLNKRNYPSIKGDCSPACSLIPALLLLLIIMTGCGGSKIALDPDSRDFYETARLIMTKQERDIFNHLPDKDARKEFILDFWAKRDPDPATEENEFREEFFRRIDYANQRFNEGTLGWKTDRGRVYIYFGQPDRIERRPMLNNPNIKALQIWIYYRYNFGIEFIDKRGDGSYTFDPYSGIIGSFFDAKERAQMGLNYRNDGRAVKYINFKLKYDRQKKEVAISIPVKNLSFIEADGLLKADFEFRFYVYASKQKKNKQTFQENRPFEITEEKLLETKEITFNFPFEIEPGKYYFDVVITIKPELTKTRKIFTVKI
jgi:GWxTD domain-containing protein